MLEAEICLFVDNYLVIYNGSHTFNIVWVEDRAQDLYCFTNNEINSNSSVAEIEKVMMQGYCDFNYGND
tara:strand:+ start:2905 stop:3111 length:207 start_codon:yes stop_codon:yes gene_type:complete